MPQETTEAILALLKCHSFLLDPLLLNLTQIVSLKQALQFQVLHLMYVICFVFYYIPCNFLEHVFISLYELSSYISEYLPNSSQHDSQSCLDFMYDFNDKCEYFNEIENS